MPKSQGKPVSTRFDRRESLGYLVNHLGRMFARALERRLAKHHVALGQFGLLLVLWEEDGLTQSEIARRLDIEQPTVANTLRRMERDGLIETISDPTNRRHVLMKLTNKGRALERSLTAEARAVNEAAARGMSAGDVDLFRAAILRLESGLAESLSFETSTRLILKSRRKAASRRTG